MLFLVPYNEVTLAKTFVNISLAQKTLLISLYVQSKVQIPHLAYLAGVEFDPCPLYRFNLRSLPP